MATLWFVETWPNGIVPYLIDNSLANDAKQDVLNAIEQVEKKTLIQFVGQTNEADYLLFTLGGDTVTNPNWQVPPNAEHPFTSDVLGFCTGISSVQLAKDKGWLAMHEIGHALGLMHEHQRSDRDSYVQLVCSNIPCQSPDFLEWTTSDTQGLSYDPESVMHYGADWQARANPGMKWIGPANEGIHKDNGWEKLTANDIHALNRFYLNEYGECADLIIYRKSTGYINNNLITNNARGIGEIFSEFWTTGYEITEAFQMNGKPYCICYREDGYLFTANIFDNGYVDRIDSSVQNWSKNYVHIKPFQMYGNQYCICHKESGYLFTATISGEGYIDQIDSTIQQWSEGYTTMEPFQMNDIPYCICYKAETGYLFTAIINPNGYLDEIPSSVQTWTKSYIIKPFQLNGRSYCACYKKDDGYFFVATIDANGYIDRINSTVQNWTPNYTLMGVYYIDNRPYLTLYRAESGYIIACSISDALYVDQFWSDHWSEDYTSMTLIGR